MAIWRDDVRDALEELGRVATLDEIYQAVRRVRSGDLPATWKAVVRRELEYNSSDSLSYQHRFDLFKSAGIGSGRWSLRAIDGGQTSGDEPIGVDAGGVPLTVMTLIRRIVRDTPMIRKLKKLYDNRCQLCRTALETADGTRYSEGHHVMPLSQKHGGPDRIDNILILCPNCHALCDLGFIALDASSIHWQEHHRLHEDFLDYHNHSIHRKQLLPEGDI